MFRSPCVLVTVSFCCLVLSYPVAAQDPTSCGDREDMEASLRRSYADYAVDLDTSIDRSLTDEEAFALISRHINPESSRREEFTKWLLSDRRGCTFYWRTANTIRDHTAEDIKFNDTLDAARITYRTYSIGFTVKGRRGHWCDGCRSYKEGFVYFKRIGCRWYRDTRRNNLLAEENQELPAKYGFIGKSGDFVIPAKYDRAHVFSEGLAAVSEDGLYGYVNTEGRMVIPPQFEEARIFSEGLATVKMDKVYSLIDRSGKIPQPEYRGTGDIGPFKEGIARRGSGSGFVDRRLKKVAGGFDYVCNFSEGLACVYSIDRHPGYGYINTSGRFVLEPRYEFDDAWEFSEGLAAMQTPDCKYGFIDKSGEFVIPATLGFTDSMQEGMARFRFHGKFGFIDKKGETVIEPQYQWVGSFSEGLAPYYRNGKFGYLDRNGKEVIEPQFLWAEDFREGLAPASILTEEP